MALATLAYTYCTQAQIEQFLSVNGLLLRLDDDSGGTISAGTETNALNDAINEATETINFYCLHKYAASWLATSNWVNLKAVAMACYAVCGRRGNPVPEIIIERAEKAEEDLKAIADGSRLIPGLPLRRTLSPDMSNVRVDPHYSFRVIRVEREQSTKRSSKLPVRTDYLDAFMYEI